MPADDSFADFLARLRTDQDEAAHQLFGRYTSRLIGLARVELDHRLRQKVDPDDVLQSVYKSFFQREAAGQFNLPSWDSLWGLLATMTVRKCARWNRHFQTEGRAVSRELSDPPGADDSNRDWGAADAFPTPPEVLMLTELVEGLLGDLGPANGPILVLALQGYSVREICDQLQRSQRAVYRILERIKDRLRVTEDKC
jgi:RNA polymerase sigma-70 factor (ECF subfamily)